MKILLVKPGSFVPTYFAPLGIAYIAAALEKAGHSVQILDLTAESIMHNDFSKNVAGCKPDIIGISCMITEYKRTLEISKACKNAASETPVIVGGPLPSSVPNIFLKNSTIDAVVMGEGEETILEVVNRFEKNANLKAVKGTAYKDDGKFVLNQHRPPISDVDSIAYPARHLLNMDCYISSFENWFGISSKIRATNVISSRGCPYNCIYCYKGVSGYHWRGRSAPNIVDEIQSLVEKYDINGIIFNDDLLDIDKKRVYKLCDEIDQRRLDIVWGFSGGRVNHCDEKLYRRMQKSGCKFIGFGIESGNQQILDFMRRGITLEQVHRAIVAAKRAGLRTLGYFMLGMLGENEKTIKETINLAKKLPLDSGGFSRVVPLPGTDLYYLARREGFVNDDDFVAEDLFGGNIALTHNLNAKELDKLVRQAYWEFFWSRPSRRLLKPVCGFIANFSPLVYGVMGGKLDLFVRLNRIRETLHLPLP